LGIGQASKRRSLARVALHGDLGVFQPESTEGEKFQLVSV
jgi:hypothetical protein